ncbi:MAG: hypothetical protein LBE37_07520 [Sphingobacterium sp.]|nr:hypothetical protein [Sphingobacterium sp.]
MKRELQIKRIIYTLLLLGIVQINLSCSKVEYTSTENPAYLRVFNNMYFYRDAAHKSEPYPMFTMLIDPSFDAQGKLTGAAIVGDHLDQRDSYAPPYPTHIGNSTSVFNPEYPGKEKVMVGPILNGFDLSSWAQIPSGKKRVMFVYRPKTTVPFFELEDRLRSTIFIDTTLNITEGEVYTLNLIQKDFNTKKNGIILRQENFHKIPLADSLTYVNFYNMSAKGYLEASKRTKEDISNVLWFNQGLRDTLSVHLSIMENYIDDRNFAKSRGIAGYDRQFLTTLLRDSESSRIAPYQSFPTFPRSGNNSIYTDVWQMFFFRHPSIDVDRIYQYGIEEPDGKFAMMACYKDGRSTPPYNPMVYRSPMFPNLLVNTHSGVHNPRTFSSVNTIEIVNGRVFLTTVQREYAPPIYRK